jgi:hypothetical protein
MLSTKHRGLAGLVAALLISAAPAEADACWLFDCCGHHSRTTFYAPVAAAPACNTCAQQTVSYVPQTAYRPLVTTTPVTALRPVTAADPCTGCPTTVMQPTTSYVQRTVMMPYTTYRPVVQTSYYAPAVAAPVMAAPACATGTCGVAPTSTYYQPATVAPVITAPAPSISQPGCCGVSSTSSTFAAPTLNAASYHVPSSAVNSGNASSQIPQATFSRASEAIANPKAESATSPAPAAKDNDAKSEPAPLPKLLDPQNRTTLTPPGWSYTPVALKDPRPSALPIRSAPLDDGGWEAAR